MSFGTCPLCKRSTRQSHCRDCGREVTRPVLLTQTGKKGLLCQSCYRLVYDDKLDHDSMYAIHRYGNRY